MERCGSNELCLLNKHMTTAHLSLEEQKLKAEPLKFD
jgi:hypothetical protein